MKTKIIFDNYIIIKQKNNDNTQKINNIIDVTFNNIKNPLKKIIELKLNTKLRAKIQ